MNATRMIGCFGVLLGMLCLPGCRGTGNVASQHAPGTVTHAVFFYLKTPGDAAARQQLVEASKTFMQIPGVLAVRAGPMIPSTRPVVDSAYDVGVVITFTDRAAMAVYGPHPIHKAAAEGVMKDLVAKVVIYDFENQ